MLLFVVLFVLVGVVSARCLREKRRDELSRMGSYEWISIRIDLTFDREENTLSFGAFGNDYQVSLLLKKHMIPNNVQRTNGVPYEGDLDGYLTSLKLIDVN